MNITESLKIAVKCINVKLDAQSSYDAGYYYRYRSVIMITAAGTV